MLFPLAQQIPDHRVAAAVDTVFRDPSFRGLTLGESLKHWLLSQVLRLLGLLIEWYTHLRASPWAFWLVVAIVAALVLAIVGRAVTLYQLRRADVARGFVWGAMGGVPGEDPWSAAESLASSGDYTSAAHALYAAMLESAARQREIRLHPSKTVGDYVRELRARSSSLFGRFREFGRSYEVVIYGIGVCDADRYRHLHALATPVVRPHG
ncbi:MAG: DUF4129 domain-containing protein [Gemmatimonadaceae bacterium]